jgi:hypothetical protein
LDADIMMVKGRVGKEEKELRCRLFAWRNRENHEDFQTEQPSLESRIIPGLWEKGF